MKKKSVRRVAMKFQKIQTLHLRYKILLCTVSAVHSSLAYHAFLSWELLLRGHICLALRSA